MQYTWFISSTAILIIWLFVYVSLNSRKSRTEMLVVSFWTSLLGLTEPLFVPEYWNPPSLFNLAQNTGFDIESLLFAFSIGGLAVIIYEKIFTVRHEIISQTEKHHSRHRYHLFALFSAPIIFAVLFVLTDLNPIYSTSLALIGGGLFTWYCRPDLKRKMFASAFVFTALYFAFFLALVTVYPGYVELVWNFSGISGVLFFGVPLEELIFAFSLGFLWSSIYEHVKWYRIKLM